MESASSDRPTVVSSTCQEFLGERYYLCGEYFRRTFKGGSRLLHREVWASLHGEIPEGFHVHHVDHNKTNNDPSNLRLVSDAEHKSHHSNEPHRISISRENLKRAIAEAPKWHASEAGRKWHREHARRVADAQVANVESVCVVCGSKTLGKLSSGKMYCSKVCTSQHRRDTGVDNEKRLCVTCGSEYDCNKYSRKKYCSRTCAAARRAGS